MKHSRKRLLFVIINALLTSSLVCPGSTSAIQLSERTLDIERFSSEPLELVELKVGDQSVKDGVKIKSRSNGEGLDTVSFNAEPGWFRHLEVRMRNVSGTTITGVRANLEFQFPPAKTLYSLPLIASTRLQQGFIEPDGQVTLKVTDQAWKLHKHIFQHYDVNPDAGYVKFRVDLIQFEGDRQWSNGHMLHLGTNNPTSRNRFTISRVKIFLDLTLAPTPNVMLTREENVVKYSRLGGTVVNLKQHLLLGSAF